MRIDQWNAVAAAGKLCNGIDCDPKLYNRTSNPNQWDRFVLRHRAQVLEVLTKYGEICEASFDMDFPAIADEDMTDTFMLYVHRHQRHSKRTNPAPSYLPCRVIGACTCHATHTHSLLPRFLSRSHASVPSITWCRCWCWCLCMLLARSDVDKGVCPVNDACRALPCFLQ